MRPTLPIMLYALYVLIDNEWQKQAEFEAADNVDAFGKGLSFIPREHLHRPIALRPHGQKPPESGERIA